MALFSYQALSKDGKRVQGTIDVPSEDVAREQLAKQGLYPISINATTQERLSFFSRISVFFARSISYKDKILFTKQLSVLLKSGVPILQAIELLIEQFDGRLRAILIEIKDSVKEGNSFAEGLARYPKVFENVYIQLVRAGEASGKLEVILDRLVEYMERREAITKRVKAALRYPMIQLSVVGLVVVALLTFVLPSLAETFSTHGGQLPATTAFLLGLSDFLIYYWYILLGIIAVTVVAFRYWRSTPKGALLFDKFKLKIPVIKFFARMGAVVQFSRTLGMLIESGVILTEALDIVVSIIDNKVLLGTLEEARDKIIKQGKIAQYLKQTEMFPSIAIYLIKTGEETGELGQMLLTVAQNYENDLSEYSDTLSSLLEPVMLLVMGVVVGFIVLSVMQPIMSQTELFNA